MSNLQTIELILGPNKSAKDVADIGAYTGQGKCIPPFASVARWATWRALDFVLNAFGRAAVKPTQPFAVTTIRLNAPFPAELLPCKDYTLRTNTRVLDFLTKVDIAVAPCDPASGHLGRQDVSRDIPSFFEALPATLKDLSLALPPDLRDFLNPLDDSGFQRLLDQGVHFQELHSLSLGNICLFETHTLRQFLIRHHASLRLLHLSIEVQRTETSLALLRDIEASLQLKRFDLDDLFSEADKLTLRDLWMPESRCGRRTWRLLRGTAEDIWYNGIHIDAEDPTLGTEEASGYLDLNSFNIAAEQSGTAAGGD